MHLSYYQYFQLFSLLLALVCRKGLNYFGLGILLPILVITNLAETLGNNWRLFLGFLPRNHVVYNVYYLILTPMYFYLYASMLGGSMAERRRLRWIALAIEIFLLFNFFFVQGVLEFNTFSALLVAIICIILSCLVLARLTMRKDDEASLLNDPIFWINSLILLFNLVSLLILGMYKYIVGNGLVIRNENLYLAIMPAANAVYYLGLGCAFLLCQLQKEQITTSILAVILVLLFFGVLFLVMLAYYNFRRRQTAKEKKDMQAVFEEQLSQARVEIQQQTLTFLAQEIHDNVGQILSLAKIQLSSFREGDPIDFPLLHDARENVNRSLQDLRGLAHGLHAGKIRSFNIREAIDQEVQRISRTGALSVSFTSEGTEQAIGDDKQLILFRIIQECLNNCLKHARATNVNIGLNWFPNQLRVRVRDDGQGFDAESALRRSNGLGLQNILNRARVTGGSGDIRSRPGEGTTITVQIPYE